MRVYYDQDADVGLCLGSRVDTDCVRIVDENVEPTQQLIARQ